MVMIKVVMEWIAGVKIDRIVRF